MRNIFEHYSQMSIGKKIMTLLCCPCVSIYYLLYNILNYFWICIESLLKNYICPLLNKIIECITNIIEKICSCFDCIFDNITKFFEYLWDNLLNCLKNIFSIFKPCTRIISRCLNCVYQNIYYCCENILSCCECFFVYIAKKIDFCLEKIDNFCLKPIINCIKCVCIQIYELNSKYIFRPICDFLKKFFDFLWGIIVWLYENIIKPIKDYILYPIYRCLMDYFFLVIYRYFRSIFRFVYNTLKMIFTKIGEIFIEIKNILFFFLTFFIKTKKNKTSNKEIQQENDFRDKDLEMLTVKNPMRNTLFQNNENNKEERIFCFNKEDFLQNN